MICCLSEPCLPDLSKGGTFAHVRTTSQPNVFPPSPPVSSLNSPAFSAPTAPSERPYTPEVEAEPLQFRSNRASQLGQFDWGALYDEISLHENPAASTSIDCTIGLGLTEMTRTDSAHNCSHDADEAVSKRDRNIVSLYGTNNLGPINPFEFSMDSSMPGDSPIESPKTTHTFISRTAQKPSRRHPEALAEMIEDLSFPEEPQGIHSKAYGLQIGTFPWEVVSTETSPTSMRQPSEPLSATSVNFSSPAFTSPSISSLRSSSSIGNIFEPAPTLPTSTPTAFPPTTNPSPYLNHQGRAQCSSTSSLSAISPVVSASSLGSNAPRPGTGVSAVGNPRKSAGVPTARMQRQKNILYLLSSIE